MIVTSSQHHAVLIRIETAMPTTSRSLARLLLSCLVLMGSACSTQHATYVPDGRRGYLIDCEGFLSSYATCLVKAGRACGSQGYDTIHGGADDRSLLIACKVPH